MKKKSFGLAAAVAVLMVLGGSYALLANHNRIQESESAAAESETGVAVATIASDKVSSFQLADGDTSFTLTKTDNSWICVQDETFPLSNDAASELVNTFTSLQAVRDLGTAQDGENYGFSENAPTVTLTSPGSMAFRMARCSLRKFLWFISIFFTKVFDRSILILNVNIVQLCCQVFLHIRHKFLAQQCLFLLLCLGQSFGF